MEWLHLQAQQGWAQRWSAVAEAKEEEGEGREARMGRPCLLEIGLRFFLLLNIQKQNKIEEG